MRILLTGGSGFLGSYVADQFSEQGHSVRALVRASSDKRALEKLRGLELAVGAVESRASLDDAVKGCDAVVHVAGLIKARSPKEFFEVNAAGTKNLLEAAIAAGSVGRFVQVSSLAAIGPSFDGKSGRRRHPAPPRQQLRPQQAGRRVGGAGRGGKAYFVEDGAVYVWREALEDMEMALGKQRLPPQGHAVVDAQAHGSGEPDLGQGHQHRADAHA